VGNTAGAVGEESLHLLLEGSAPNFVLVPWDNAEFRSAVPDFFKHSPAVLGSDLAESIEYMNRYWGRPWDRAAAQRDEALAHNLASGEFRSLLEKYPGLQSLAAASRSRDVGSRPSQRGPAGAALVEKWYDLIQEREHLMGELSEFPKAWCGAIDAQGDSALAQNGYALELLDGFLTKFGFPVFHHQAGTSLKAHEVQNVPSVDRAPNGAQLASGATDHEFSTEPEHSVPELILALMSSNSQVRSGAIEALKKIGEPTIPALIQALRHVNEGIRAGVASALGGIRPVSSASITALVQALGDESEDVCSSVGTALRAIGPEASSAVPALIEALRHPRAIVRRSACWALEGVGPDARLAEPILVEMLSDQAIHWHAMLALNKIIPNFADSLRNDVEPYSRILEGDVFANHLCTRCGTGGALFATPRMFTACPKCLAERIRDLRKVSGVLPAWVHYLEGAADEEVARQARAEDAALTASFDDFYRCGRCDTLVPAAEARYYVPPNGNSSPPYCIECYERVRRGE